MKNVKTVRDYIRTLDLRYRSLAEQELETQGGAKTYSQFSSGLESIFKFLSKERLIYGEVFWREVLKGNNPEIPNIKLIYRDCWTLYYNNLVIFDKGLNKVKFNDIYLNFREFQRILWAFEKTLKRFNRIRREVCEDYTYNKYLPDLFSLSSFYVNISPSFKDDFVHIRGRGIKRFEIRVEISKWREISLEILELFRTSSQKSVSSFLKDLDFDAEIDNLLSQYREPSLQKVQENCQHLDNYLPLPDVKQSQPGTRF